MIDETTGEEWRFHIVTNPHDETDMSVYRGRKYRLPEQWTADAWHWYWDGDSMVAFYDEGHRGLRAVTSGDDTDRAIAAYKAERDGRPGADGGLTRTAQRINENAESTFLKIALDRGTDLYVLSWDGDPDGDLRNEVECVYHGDIWRIEVERHFIDGSWTPDDEVPEEYHGEERAQAGFEKEFPLAEFPAEMLVEGSD